jgi:DNA-binding MarR family transcriptional regulator
MSGKNVNLDGNSEITLDVLSAVDADNKVTQRSLSTELGIALGLTNTYLKRCVDKGLVKIKQVPSNRYLYYLTPSGFTEKARLAREYLSYSLQFYRKAREECDKIILNCYKEGSRNILLSDKNELAEIVILSSLNMPVNIVGIIGKGSSYLGVPVIEKIPKSFKFDKIIITDMLFTDKRFKYLCKIHGTKNIILPSILKNKIGK